MVLSNYKMTLHGVDYCKAYFGYVTMVHYKLNCTMQYSYAKYLFDGKIKIEMGKTQKKNKM